MTMDGVAWSEVRIGDLGEVFTGRTPPTARLAYFGDEFPFITPGDMRQGKYVRVTQRSVSHEGAELLGRIQIPANSVCASCIGWQMGEVIMTDRPSFTNQQINSIVSNGIVEPSFLYYSLRPRKQELLSLGASTGVRTPILNKSAFCDLKVKVPPLPVQRQIASILSAYDELIENNQQHIRIMERMARSLCREWILSQKDKTSSLGRLDDLCDLVKDQFDEGLHSELPLLDLAHIPSRCLAPQDTGKASELTTSRIIFQRDDILFGAIRTYLHKVVIAPYSGVTNVSVFVMRAKRLEYRSLLAIIASDPETILWADQYSTGTKMPVIKWDILKTMPIPDASRAVQFEKVARPMLDTICVLAIQNQNLRRTRDLLLPRLMSGQVDVSETKTADVQVGR